VPQGLESDGFHVGRGIVPQQLIDDALRVLHIDMLEKRALGRDAGERLWATDWFSAPQVPRRDRGLLVNVEGEPVPSSSIPATP
jgi:hypothetical protein